MKVFVVESSSLVRERLVELIETAPGLERAGEAADFEAAVAGIIAARPDVAVLDIKLANDGHTGLDVLKRVRTELPAIKAVVLSDYATPRYIKASAEAGAEHFLDKHTDIEHLAEVLRAFADGERDG